MPEIARFSPAPALGRRPQAPIGYWLVQVVAGTPTRFMLVTWAAALVAFFFGPLAFHDRIHPATWVFLAACIAAFCVGSALAVFPHVPVQPPPQTRRYKRHVTAVMRACVIVGLLGAACLCIDRVFFSGMDFSDGFAAARMARAEEVNAGDSDELRRTPLLYIGYLTFALAIPGYLLYLLFGDHMKSRHAIYAHLGLLGPAAYSVLYGGRSPLGLLIGFAGGAIVVRLLTGRRALPRHFIARGLFVAVLAGVVAYSGFVFSERRELQGEIPFTGFEERFETIYSATIDPRIGDLVEQQVVPEETTMNLLMTYFYFTHELPMLDRVLHSTEKFGPFYGQFQFYLPAALVWRLFPALSVEREIITQGQQADVYGWFSTAWGGMYIDFGIAGALFQAALCGWICGQLYRRARRQDSLPAQLGLCYAVAGIFASPVLPIFTISVAPLMLAAVLVAAYFVQRPRARTIFVSVPTSPALA